MLESTYAVEEADIGRACHSATGMSRGTSLSFVSIKIDR